MFRKIEKFLLMVAALATLPMMLGTVVDVILRLGFGKGIPGVVEGTGLLMIVLVCLALAYTQSTGGNIEIQVVTERLPRTVRSILNVVVSSVVLVFIALLVWRTGVTALESWQAREYSWGLIHFPAYPARILLSAGCMFLLVAVLMQLIDGVRSLGRPLGGD